jgi:NADP-dependent alcohol dehydrogenase
MLDFIFHNPVKLIFGKDKLSHLQEEIPKEARILMTYGGGSIKKNGIYDSVMSSLSGRTVFEFSGIEPNPRYETLMRAVELCRKEKIDFLLAVGGGSVIDGTKFIATAVNFNGDPWDIIEKFGRGNNKKIENTLPLGTILTLPATGSEMNYNAVVTRGDNKRAFMNPAAYPTFSILDPTYTFSLPEKQTANGIIDAFVHVMEQYLTYPVGGALQDRFSEGILSTLVEEGPKVMRNPKDYDARANVMFCATMALNYLIGMGVPGDWSTHMIGHQLTAFHGLDHGVTLAILLPSVMSVMHKNKREKILQYGSRIWGITSGSEEERIEKAIDKTREFFESLNVKTHLSDYGITKDDIPTMVNKLKEHGIETLGEHEDMTASVCTKVFEASL